MRARRFLERGLSILVILAMALALVPAYAALEPVPPVGVFFSEYIEGSSNNKALEIYNLSGSAVDLGAGGYNIQMFFNGSASAGLTIDLTGAVADGDVYVVAQSSANAAILAQADQTNSSSWFNGDDAVVLRKGDVVLDVIGQIGYDPGAEWGTGLVSTADNTLRRKATVCAGDPDGGNPFDPGAQWDGLVQDTFDGLGVHTASCGIFEVQPRLNEFSASTAGTDVEYVEIYGAADTDYSAYTILEIEGDAGTAVGTVDEVIPVGTTDAYGFWMEHLAANALENGTITLLLVKDFVGALGNDLDADNDGVFDATPWSAVVDAVAVNDGGAGDFTYGVPVLGVSYDGLPFAPGGASRIPDGYDTDAATDWVRNDFDLAGIPGFDGTPIAGEAYNTPGGSNAWANPIVEPAAPRLNEFSASTAGTDVEYVEIYGEPNTDYSAYTILEIEGDSGSAIGAVDEVIPVGTTDANGLWLASLPANALENGSITLLLVKDFTGALNDDLDGDNDGAFDVMPWTEIVDAVAVNDGGAGDVTYGIPALGVSYDGLPFAPGGASRIPDGYDTDAASDWVRNDFDLAGIPGYAGTIAVGEAYNTPGAPNEAYVAPPPPPEACGDPFTPIYAIQGDSPASPLAGTEVALEGVVVGDFQNNATPDDGDLNGFHVQDPTGDGNAATSDGVFVYAPGGIDVATGDAVRVRGMVSEYNGMTEVTASQIWVCSSGNTVEPTALSLPVTSLDDFEAYEGMLVTFPQALVISEYYNFDRFGEIVLSSQRHGTPTALFEPGSPEALALEDQITRDRITLDDGRTVQNPDPAIHPNGAVFDLNNLFRGGDTVTNVTGVLDYSFDLYRIQPTQGASYASANPRPIAPDEVGGSLKVASFNVLNYFTTIDTGAFVCGPLANQECRGADTLEEFTRQRAKIIAALVTIDADVVGLIEIENHSGDVPVADLVAGLNEATAPDTYAYVETGAIGDDAIRQAFIYKPATVSLVGGYAVLDDASFTNPLAYADGVENPPQLSRPALAQTFMDSTTGGVFTVAVNHLKSKGSSCEAYGDPDLKDGQGNCNLTRKLGAEALLAWLATDPTGSGDSDVLLIGDLNAYDKEDPVDVLVAGGYTDLIRLYVGEDAYSYVFDGQVGYLDHGLAGASTSLNGEVTGATVWHINADEPDLIDYDMTFKQDAQDALYAPDPYRSSDHDPVIIGLDVCDEIAPEFTELSAKPDRLWPVDHKYRTVKIKVDVSDNFDLNPTVTLVSVTSNEPDNGLGDGDMPDDIVMIDDYTFDLRAERMGLYPDVDRIYTITYMVTDDCGNSTMASVEVIVPHDMRK